MSGDAEAARDWQKRLAQPSAHALYLHIPFCARKCAYCDFASWPEEAAGPSAAAYARSIARMVDEAESLGLLERVRCAYVGGGTPSLLGTDIEPLVCRVAALGVRELTCEANPDSLSDAVLEGLARGGATRLSVGVQSLDDAELAVLGRLHDAERARERVRAACASGLDVSCDLMCAVPEQTDASWERTLGGFLELGATHVSVYPLTIEEGTPLARAVGDDDPAWNAGDVQADRMLKAQAVLEGKGFKRYEVASYAFENHQCEHNKAYWTGMPYLGLGTQASSMLTLKGYSRLCEACPRLPSAPLGCARVRLTMTSPRGLVARDPRLASQGFSLEFLDAAQAAAEDLMLGARLSEGLDLGLLAHARALLGGSLDDCLEGLVARGLLARAGRRLAPTGKGWLLGNELYGRL